LLVAGLIATPIIAVILLAVAPSDDIWHHLASTVLPHYLVTTALLATGVGVGTTIIGVGTAWLVTMCRFPMRSIFEWALLLPLAVPSYVVAYVYTDILEYAGPLQAALRENFGWASRQAYWFPEIRSLGGAIAMMTLVLYPYVYLLARAAFLEQSVCVLEVSRTLGKGPWKSFFRVALPLARPAIVIGLTLVMMETLNDFGTVDFFAVATLTTGIYDVWLNMNSTAGAAQLAVLTLGIVVLLIIVERWARRRKRFHHTTSRYRALATAPLSPSRAVLAFLACLTPVLLGFVVPATQLVRFAFSHRPAIETDSFLELAANSLALASITAGLAVGVGLFLAYGVRVSRSPWLAAAARFASIGYAIPGAVLAVGVVVPLAAWDNAVDAVARAQFGVSPGLLLSGTVFAMVFGYLVRFLALSYGTIEAGLGKVTPSMDGAARTLGHAPFSVLRRVHLPLLRGSLLTAAILVFVDCMKELPLTLLLRPFNFETLATNVHQLASAELLEQSARGALAIVAAGILPVIALSRTIRRSRPGQAPIGNRS
jgi:iron(III) transport system permease protein